MEFTNNNKNDIEYRIYTDESMLDDIQKLVAKDLSEPYSIFTYRYFLHKWPQLCVCVYDINNDKEEMIGTIVCKAEFEDNAYVGYIAMLAVKESYRGKGIGSNLVKKGINAMINDGCTEITLETEVSNNTALKLYDRLGFMRLERYEKYYLNGGDAYRLKLYLDEVNDILKEKINHNNDDNDHMSKTESNSITTGTGTGEGGTKDNDVYFKVNTRGVFPLKDFYFGQT